MTEIDGENNVGVAIFLDDAVFTGDNVFGQFHLTGNSEYIFGSESTQTITDVISFENNSDEWINLHSNVPGEQATIHKPDGNFTVEGVIVKDMMVSGNDLPVIANNSIDLGNNSNWEFSLPEETTLYWIGGSGNWDDPNHWSFTSGGIPANLYPNIMSNVIFDENSFNSLTDSVQIDSESAIIAMCKNMRWQTSIENQPYFIGNENSSLMVLGSYILSENMNFQFEGVTEFIHIDGVPQQTDSIQTASNILLNNVVFNGVGGSWILIDDLTLDTNYTWDKIREIYLVEGGLNTNSKNIYCASIISNYHSNRTLNIQNSTIKLFKTYDLAWYIDMENMSFTGENSSIFIKGAEATFKTLNGISPAFGKIYLNGSFDSLVNIGNQVYYDQIQINGPVGNVSGNYFADSVFFNGSNSTLEDTSYLNVVMVNGMHSYIHESQINRLIVNDVLHLVGSNHINYAKFNKDVYFIGDNTFDTLIIYPGPGNYQNLGNFFYFGSGFTQTVFDSLYIRGNPCSNINLQSTGSPEPTYLKKDYGFDIICDFLNITGVAAQSENLNFYAGANSTGLPLNDPPPGWIFENGSNYIFGFQGSTVEPCIGEPYIVDASNFNGDDNTQYYWNGSSEPDDITYEITESATVSIIVKYTEDCYVEDYIIIEFDSCEYAVDYHFLDSNITVYPNPSNGLITIKTSNLVGGIEMTLYTWEGKAIFNEEINIQGIHSTRIFDFSKLKKGIYYVVFRNNEGTIPKKIIIK